MKGVDPHQVPNPEPHPDSLAVWIKYPRIRICTLKLLRSGTLPLITQFEQWKNIFINGTVSSKAHLFSDALKWMTWRNVPVCTIPVLFSLNSSSFRRYAPWLHCKDKILKNFETNIPRKGISGPQSQFPHSYVCERFIYSHDRSAYSAAGKYVDRSWGYINRSQTHECGNRDWGRAIPFLEIYKWDFRCSVSRNVPSQLSPSWRGTTTSWHSP